MQVIRHWDIGSGSERQLALERRTYLFSTLLAFVLVAQLAALLLFVFNADRLAVMFVGAMCAVGTLNVNAWGFPSLIMQIAVFFLAAMWLALNHVDTLARDYPLVRIKYGLLLVLLPLLAPTLYVYALVAAAAAWSVAFLIYLGLYTPWLMSTRLDGKDG